MHDYDFLLLIKVITVQSKMHEILEIAIIVFFFFHESNLRKNYVTLCNKISYGFLMYLNKF